MGWDGRMEYVLVQNGTVIASEEGGIFERRKMCGSQRLEGGGEERWTR